MDFHLNETQEMLQDGARRFFESEFDTEKALAFEASHDGFAKDIWDKATQLGWHAVALPESFGGSGLGIFELCILAEEVGRAGMSLPLLINSGVAASCLQEIADSPIAEKLLKRMASENYIVTAALVDADGRDERSLPTMSLKNKQNSMTITGTKHLVPFASVADVIIVLAVTDKGERVIISTPADAKGITIIRHRSLGGDPLFQVEFEDVKIEEDWILARGEAAKSALDKGLEVATVMAMAEAVGCCESIINLTAEYAKIREQFGVAIGSFQAVSHPIADMRIQTDACRLLMQEAALLLDQGKPASFEISSAKLFANEAVSTIALDGHRLHGAIGYSSEYNLQLFSRRAKAFTVSWGDTDRQVERSAMALGI